MLIQRRLSDRQMVQKRQVGAPIAQNNQYDMARPAEAASASIHGSVQGSRAAARGHGRGLGRPSQGSSRPCRALP